MGGFAKKVEKKEADNKAISSRKRQRNNSAFKKYGSKTLDDDDLD